MLLENEGNHIFDRREAFDPLYFMFNMIFAFGYFIPKKQLDLIWM